MNKTETDYKLLKNLLGDKYIPTDTFSDEELPVLTEQHILAAYEEIQRGETYDWELLKQECGIQ